MRDTVFFTLPLRAHRTCALVLLLSLLLLGCRNDGPVPPQGEPAALGRITVTGSGLFRVEPRALAALGWAADAPLALSLNGAPLPYQLRDGALYFFLPDNTPTRYSSQHTLWLRHGEAGESSVASDDATALETVMGEQRLTGSEQYSAHYVGDPWFWRTLIAPTTEAHTIATPGRVDGPVTITVVAGGVTAVDHQIRLTLSNESEAAATLDPATLSAATEAGTVAWSGGVRLTQTLTATLPAGEALALIFEVPERTEVADISMLDEVTIHYPARPLAQEGGFRGHSPQAGAAPFEGLSADALAWQTAPTVATLRVEAGDGAARVFLPAGNPFIVAEPGEAQPTTLERAEATALPTEGAEYVAIVAPTLLEATEPLLALHQEEGMSTLALTPQQVYDAYTNGAVDPLAFRALLQDAEANWGIKPRFLLLVGDSTYDPNGNQSELPAAYLPSPFVETVFGGETVSDNPIADTDEDGYPDIALGRLPARTPEQMATIVGKIRAYTQEPPEGPWRGQVLFAADGREEIFRNTSEQLRGTLPSNVEAVTVYPESAAADAMDQVLVPLNAGTLIVNYVGHGSVQQWGRDQLLTTEAATGLSNAGRLPIFINMTCLTGLFSHPTQESLAEVMLWAAEGGAIAAVVPSSLTLPTNQSVLNQALLTELLSAERPTLGEAVMRAKQGVPLNNENERDIITTFNLLGDPALRPATRPMAEARGEQ